MNGRDLEMTPCLALNAFEIITRYSRFNASIGEEVSGAGAGTTTTFVFNSKNEIIASIASNIKTGRSIWMIAHHAPRHLRDIIEKQIVRVGKIYA